LFVAAIVRPTMNVITRKLLSGHTDIECGLQADSAGTLLASGSEDRTARIWDLRCHRSIRRATSVNIKSAVNAICFCGSQEQFLCAAAENQVFVFDLRRPEVLLVSSEQSFCEIAKEDINQLSCSGNMIAAADDSGLVELFDLSTMQCAQILSHPNHQQFCMACQFVPKQNILLSGGFDGQLLFWDLQRSRLFAALSCVEVSSASVNPCYIHSVAVDPVGERAAVALGDTTLQIVDIGKQKKLFRLDDLNGHGAAVVQCCWLQHQSDRVVSASDDCKIILWDVKGLTNASGGKKKKKKKEKPQKDEDPSRILQKIAHGTKMNWLTMVNRPADNLYVADTSNDISVYTLQ